MCHVPGSVPSTKHFVPRTTLGAGVGVPEFGLQRTGSLTQMTEPSFKHKQSDL